MAIKIYSDSNEFMFEESHIQSLIENGVESPKRFDIWAEPDDEFLENEEVLEFRDDYSYYVVSDTEDEELAEEIVSGLGKYQKISLEEIRKIFFSIE